MKLYHCVWKDTHCFRTLIQTALKNKDKNIKLKKRIAVAKDRNPPIHTQRIKTFILLRNEEVLWFPSRLVQGSKAPGSFQSLLVHLWCGWSNMATAVPSITSSPRGEGKTVFFSPTLSPGSEEAFPANTSHWPEQGHVLVSESATGQGFPELSSPHVRPWRRRCDISLENGKMGHTDLQSRRPGSETCDLLQQSSAA